MTIISLSFDDGRSDNYTNVLPILEKYNIPATFNIATAYVDKRVSPIELCCENTAMSIDNVKEINNCKLIELACHGDKHDNDLRDIIQGQLKLKEWLGICNDKQIGFASPHSRINKIKAMQLKDKLVSNNFKYVRGGEYVANEDYLRRAARRASRILPLPFLYKYAYENSLLNGNEDFFLTSVPVTREHSYSQLLGLISYAIKNDKSVIFMFHSIIKKDEDFYNNICAWDYDEFEKLCVYLDELREKRKIEIMKTCDLCNTFKRR